MSWQEVIVETQSEAVEAVSNILMEAGAEGIQIDDAADVDSYEPADATVWVDWDVVEHRESGALVAGYFPENVNLPEVINDVQMRVNQLADFGLDATPGTVTTTAVKDADWATEWQKYYHPVRVTRHLTVVPKWEEYVPAQNDEQVIVLDPGMAFGTGTHPTTRLMMQALEIVIRGEERLLDVGTGSGVLGIAAKLLGASSVLGTDIDEVAVRSAQGNLDLNPIASDIKVMASDLLQDVPAQEFDIVVANMLAEVLVPLIPQVESVLRPGGKFLLSGIYQDKADVIVAKLEASAYVVDEKMKLGEWYGLIAHRASEDEK
ncbi:50S ribosomal protein L11 methyltransferase [Weissella cibaria]|uniref:50S ribosomal protein L11 methyltransferase n=1 Tax=Weissella cibaria TaxID=137591 RepID=UPI0021BFFE6A|nr:50S ribosomal protein L11 methyltransferase [Weissella cibaria]MCT8398945.1 50S ribosomal protein L11 methyltransferase [Weissella cibaria]MCT8402111.1 50S ribosomal protein L11 methyltransferase [Weissella cibaria]